MHDASGIEPLADFRELESTTVEAQPRRPAILLPARSCQRQKIKAPTQLEQTNRPASGQLNIVQ
jgi:hypothetical protein